MRSLPGRLMVAATLLFLALGTGIVSATDYTPPHTKPGPATDTINFRAFDVDRAPLDMKAGSMDMYFFSLKTQAAKELRGTAGIKLYDAPASTISIILNPAPAPEGELNPFSLKAVRRAVQHVVNRDFVANTIYGGAASPMTTHVSPQDYDYLTIYDLVRQAETRYAPDVAKDAVDKAMRGAGADLVNGKWALKGRPIVLKFIIRVEDERRDIGDLVRAELDKLGFQVAPSYQQFAPATQAVYSTDPKTLTWHLYTEGWSRSAPQRHDYADINNMAAPWMGNMPGWQASGFWQYENTQLDQIGQKIFTGSFADAKERDELYRQMTGIELDESIRIWVATVLTSYPTSDKVQGITQDLVSGPRSLNTLREAYVPGKDTLTVGNLWVWTERSTWNPVGGGGDAYSAEIAKELSDPPVVNDPFSGLAVPFRATFNVDTAGPTGKLDVPGDAVMWDTGRKSWKAVGGNVKAVSKVTVDYSKYFSSKWHDGQPISMADVLYSIAQGWEIAYNPNKSKIEFVLATTSKPFLQTYKGFRVLDDNRVEVYVDFWHFEPSYIASYAVPSSISTPWELLAAMDQLVFDKRQGAYSDVAAARFNLPWISLVLDKDSRLVRRELLDLKARNVVPEGVFKIGNKTYVSAQEASARYQAAVDWFDAHGNLVISNGPYWLSRYDPPAQFAELKAFRDPTYPFKPGDHYKGSVQTVEVQQVKGSGLPIGKDAKFDLTMQGPGTLSARYSLVNQATGKVVTSGDATGSAGKYAVIIPADITGKLDAGLYNLYVAAYSDKVAALSERQLTLQASKSGGSIIASTTPGATGTTTGGNSTTTLFIVIGLVVAVLFVGSGLAAVLMRGKKRTAA